MNNNDGSKPSRPGVLKTWVHILREPSCVWFCFGWVGSAVATGIFQVSNPAGLAVTFVLAAIVAAVSTLRTHAKLRATGEGDS